MYEKKCIGFLPQLSLPFFVRFTAKRSKEDPDCIQTIRVDSTITKPLPDQTLAVPVIGEPQRRPSLPSVVIETDNQQDVYQKGVLQGVMDDPEIDLTDGPIDVKVEHCTRQFYLANFKQVTFPPVFKI